MKKVELTYYLEKTKTYQGRLLGLIDKEQFAHIYNRASDVTSKVSTCRTINLTELNKASYLNRRIVMAVKSKKNSGLFISRPLAEIYNCIMTQEGTENKEVESISFLDNEDNWLTLELV